MERNCWQRRQDLSPGFSIIELLVVVGIIMVVAAVALPNISQGIRNSKIKGATQEVANALQEARTKAVMRNAKTGVSLAIVGQSQYRIVFDDKTASRIADEQIGPLRHLPEGLEFALPPAGVLRPGVLFTRLGALESYTFASPCKTGEPTTDCSSNPGRGFGIQPNGAAILRISQPVTGLNRDIEIAPGGRILQSQGYTK